MLAVKTDCLPDIASRSGLDRLRLALASGAIIDTRDEDGRTALFRTARLGRTEHVKLLLESGADPNAADSTGEAPLQAAARYGHQECVEMLVKAGARIDHCPDPKLTEYSESALCSAVRKGHQQVADFLLNAGASANASTSALRFPLIKAAVRGNTAMCRRLVEAGANINQQDNFGSAALHYAVRSESLETVRELLEMGADVDAVDRDGKTPVLEAISPSHAKCVPLLFVLLKARPDLSIRGRRLGYTPLEQAVKFELEEVAELLRSAGAKESRLSVSTVSSESRKISVESEDGSSVEASFNFWEAPVEAKDRTLADEVSQRKSPALLKNFGWEASPRHWSILENCKTPIPLTRVAYFARGFFNRPSGKELEDGIDVLGESYQAAVDRFVSLGLLRVLDSIELVKLLVTTADLKKIAKTYDTRLPSKRADMIEAVLAKAKAEDFPNLLRRGPYFIDTMKAHEALQSRGDWKVRIEARLRNAIIEALLEPNLKWALLLSQEVKSLHRRPRRILPQTVCEARLVLENGIPDGINHEQSEEALLRAIAVACRIVSGANEWSQWRSVRIPTGNAGDPLTPSEFAFCIMCDDGAEAWEDTNEDD